MPISQPCKFTTAKGAHRLHERLYSLSVAVSAIAISTNYLYWGRAQFSHGDFAAIDCNQLDLSVRLPLHGPLEAALIGRMADLIEFQIEKRQPPPPTFSVWAAGIQQPPSFQNQGTMLPVFINIIGPVFVEYYEAFKQWLYDGFGHPDQWVMVWRFARVVRNSISHGGCIKIDRFNEQPVHWNRLNYSSADNGKKILGNDLAFGDVLILMFDMDEALNNLNCPLVAL